MAQLLDPSGEMFGDRIISAGDDGSALTNQSKRLKEVSLNQSATLLCMWTPHIWQSTRIPCRSKSVCVCTVDSRLFFCSGGASEAYDSATGLGVGAV